MSDNTFKDFYEELCKEFKDETMKMLLLMILIGMSPFFAEIGFPILQPLAVVLGEEDEIMRIAEYLDLFASHIIISTSAKPKDMEKQLASPLYGSVFLTLDEGRYTLENLQECVSCSRKIEKQIHRKFLIVVFVIRGIPQKYEGIFAGTVFISGKVRIAEETKTLRQELVKEMIPFAISHENEIKKEAERRLAERGEEFIVFDVAVILIKMFLRTQRLTAREIQNFDNEIETALDQIVEEWENTNNPETYAKAFRNVLYENAKGFPDLFDRERLPGDAVKRIDEVLFYDENYYYLPSNLFQKLCQKIGNVNFVEAQLINSGVLISEGGSRIYYSKKIEIVTAYGQVLRKRRIKISREKIDIPWELSFKEVLERKGEDDNNGTETGESDKCHRIRGSF